MTLPEIFIFTEEKTLILLIFKPASLYITLHISKGKIYSVTFLSIYIYMFDLCVNFEKQNIFHHVLRI